MQISISETILMHSLCNCFYSFWLNFLKSAIQFCAKAWLFLIYQLEIILQDQNLITGVMVWHLLALRRVKEPSVAAVEAVAGVVVLEVVDEDVDEVKFCYFLPWFLVTLLSILFFDTWKICHLPLILAYFNVFLGFSDDSFTAFEQSQCINGTVYFPYQAYDAPQLKEFVKTQM